MTDNIFQNAERRVESHSFTKKEFRKIDNMSDSALGIQAVRKQALKESVELEKIKEEKDNKHFEDQRRATAVVEASLKETRKTLSANHWFKDMKLKLFKDIVFELFYKSLPLDEEFLPTAEASIRFTTDTYIDQNGGFELLENAIKVTNSEFLKKVKDCCESVAKEACNNKLKKNECGDTLNFNDLSDEENKIFGDKKTNLDIDKISDLVKDKVLTVIRDEKEREAKEAELIDDIESELEDNDDVKDETTLDEAYQRIVLNKTPIEEDTLFQSLMRTTYEEFLAENIAIASTHEDEMNKEDEFNMSYDVNATEDDIDHDMLDDECDCDDEFDMDISFDADEEKLDKDFHLNESASLDMDKVFAETVSKYTLMEMLYTIKLENYNYHDIRKLTEAMLNKSKKDSLKNNLKKEIKKPSASAKYMKFAFSKNNSKASKNINLAKSYEQRGIYKSAVREYKIALEYLKKLKAEANNVPEEGVKDIITAIIPIYGSLGRAVAEDKFKGASKAAAIRYVDDTINLVEYRIKVCNSALKENFNNIEDARHADI